MTLAHLLPVNEVRVFADPDSGELRALTNPDGPPSARQLLALWHLGALAIVVPGPEHAFTRAQAAGAIAWLRHDEEVA
jgi:hypothetical protein